MIGTWGAVLNHTETTADHDGPCSMIHTRNILLVWFEGAGKSWKIICKSSTGIEVGINTWMTNKHSILVGASEIHPKSTEIAIHFTVNSGLLDYGRPATPMLQVIRSYCGLSAAPLRDWRSKLTWRPFEHGVASGNQT